MAKENVEKTAEAQDVNAKKSDDGKAYLNGVYIKNQDKSDKFKCVGFMKDANGDYIMNHNGEYQAKFYLQNVKVNANLIKEDAKPGSTMNVDIEYIIPTSEPVPPNPLHESRFKKIRTKDGKEIDERRNFVLGKDYDTTKVHWNKSYIGKDGETHYCKEEATLVNQSIEAAYESARSQYRGKGVVKDKPATPVRDGAEVSAPETSAPSADKDAIAAPTV